MKIPVRYNTISLKRFALRIYNDLGLSYKRCINVQLAFKISEVCSSILSMQFNVASLGFGRASEICKSKCNKLPYVLDFIVKN